MQCAICKGRGLCGKPCPILQQFKQFQAKIKTDFSGSSPPDVFVGRHNYPNVFTGILAPQDHGDTEELSMPEVWHEKNVGIQDILSYRSRLIYSRFTANIKSRVERNLDVMKEVAMASKPADVEVHLKRKPSLKIHADPFMPIIGNPAPLNWARLQENIKVEGKVEYLVSDTDVKSATALTELHDSNISVSSMIKLLSAGLLGMKTRRKLVPTRWAITAVDSTISELLLDKIRYYPQISEFLLFNAEYIGNHYEIILFPKEFSFEVIEAKMPGSVWNPAGVDKGSQPLMMQDYENWHGRKDYAAEVTGGYYVARIALAEYLSRIRKQASCLVLRECRPEYYAPCGVGVLRETCRDAFSKKPEVFQTAQQALNAAQQRMKLPVSKFLEKSQLWSEFKVQKRIFDFI